MDDNVGRSVALSGDTALVGAPNSAAGGAAYVFVYNGTSWIEQAKLTASDAAPGNMFGRSVALSGDMALVGAPFDDRSSDLPNTGSVYVFVRTGTSWSQQGKLTASDPNPGYCPYGHPFICARLGIPLGPGGGDQFGGAIALSGDTAIIGAVGHGSGGGAYVFVRSGTNWSQQAQLQRPLGGLLRFFGTSVALSGDTAVVATLRDFAHPDEDGSASVFVRSGSSWSHQATLFGAGTVGESESGLAVAVSGDTVLLGAHLDFNPAGSRPGAVHVFERTGTTWSQQQKLLASDGSNSDRFGISIAMSGDTALIGAWGDDNPFINSGSAYVFERSGASWVELQKLSPSDPEFVASFGVSVALTEDRCLVGSFQDNIREGAAYVYQHAAIANTSPGVDCLPDDVTFECISAPPDAAVELTVDVEDADGDALVVRWYVNGIEVPGAETQVAANPSGATQASVSFTPSLNFGTSDVEVTVDDGITTTVCLTEVNVVLTAEGPAAFCIQDELFDADLGQCSVDLGLSPLSAPEVSANCNVASITSVPAADSIFDVGVNVVTWTITDTAGNFATCEQTVRVVDTEPPLVSCGGLVQLNTDPGEIFASWTLAAPMATDNCGTPTLDVVPAWAEAGVFPIGTTVVIWTATDDATPSPNVATCMQIVEVNARPEAACAVTQLTNIGDRAEVTFVGTGSFDLEDDAAMIPIADYDWTVVDTSNPENPVVVLTASGPELEVLGAELDYGDYEVTLVVTDSLGASSEECTKSLTINPAALAVFDCEKVEVRFCLGDGERDNDDDSSADDDGHGNGGCDSDSVEISGEIGLPMGVNYTDLDPFSIVQLSVAGENFLPAPMAPLTFEVRGSHDDDWRYRDDAGTLGVTKFEIDWKGARFKYRESGVAVKFESELITSTQTVLTMEYKMSDAGGPFTVDIDGILLDVDADGVVTSGDLAEEAIVVKKNGKKVTVTLPLPLVEESVITFGGAVTGTVPVIDHYTNSLGRFKLEAESGTTLADGAETPSRTTSLWIGVGGPLYPGSCESSGDDLRHYRRKWKSHH